VSLRWRMILATSLAVLLAVLAPSVYMYLHLRSDLVAEVDRSLVQRADGLLRGSGPAGFQPPDGDHNRDVPEPGLGETDAYLHLVSATGIAMSISGPSISIPVDARTLAVAKGTAASYATTVIVDEVALRVYTVHSGHSALQVIRPLTEVQNTLKHIRVLLAFVLLAGGFLAALLAWLIAAATLSPVRRLTRAAEEVARTRDLSVRINSNRPDELGRLSASMNTMLDSLERSVAAQKQLVADASHELRTPLTSLRTNVEVLGEAEHLDPEERRKIVADIVLQTEELSGLVSDLVELARGDSGLAAIEPMDVDLDRLVVGAVARAARHYPNLAFETDLRALPVRGVVASLDRAVTNLIDNAAKFSPADGIVNVDIHGRTLTVTDHGPGIPAVDLPHVFDRFYRATTARAVPGSGLGLAIVRQTAEAHGAQVSADCPPNGGTRMRLVFPSVAEAPDLISFETHHEVDGRNEAAMVDPAAGGLSPRPV
jgi:two-component system sensor histidine kinase MprB